MIIELPWPPASLSGHCSTHYRIMRPIIAKHRLWAFQATKAARPHVPSTGDIPISVEFYPPDNRSDRINFWNRMKPYFDGIAEAMGVNDKRFLPAGYHVCEPIKGGRVVVTL